MEELERKSRIADAMNTYDHALTIIKKKGYKIFLYPDEREEFLGDFWTFDDERDFIASDPLRLLGLITLWENFGDDWQKTKVKGEYDEILDMAFSKDFILKLSDDNYTNFISNLTKFFKIIDVSFPLNPSREELISFLSCYYFHSKEKD